MNSKIGLKKAGLKTSHRKLITKSLLSDLVVYEYMTTTKAKSKLVISDFNKLITLVKGSLTDREKERRLIIKIGNLNAVKKLLEVYKTRFEKDNGGYVNIYKLGNRKGDNAEMVKLMVKGYVYKDIGKKVAPSKTSKKEVKEDKSKKTFVKGGSLDKKQFVGDANTAKVKTRSGI
jgi:large subunit ribosomal protein L17